MVNVRKFEMCSYGSASDLELDLESFIRLLQDFPVPNMMVEYTYRFGKLQHVFVIFDEK